MDKSALEEIQAALNVIRKELEHTDAETQWAALELMLTKSQSIVALGKKMAQPQQKTVTRTVAIPQTKVVRQKQQPSQPQKAKKDPGEKDLSPVKPQSPLPNQRIKST